MCIQIHWITCTTRKNKQYNVVENKNQVPAVWHCTMWVSDEIIFTIIMNYFKFAVPRHLKWSIIGAYTIILSKDIHKDDGNLQENEINLVKYLQQSAGWPKAPKVTTRKKKV